MISSSSPQLISPFISKFNALQQKDRETNRQILVLLSDAIIKMRTFKLFVTKGLTRVL